VRRADRNRKKGGLNLPDDKVTVTFIHPTNPSETLTANVSLDSTPLYLVEQLIAAAFIPPASSVGQYKLRKQDGIQLLDDVTLRNAGVGDQAQLAVDHSVTGARTAGR
jgi:hypothetical protein